LFSNEHFKKDMSGNVWNNVEQGL